MSDAEAPTGVAALDRALQGEAPGRVLLARKGSRQGARAHVGADQGLRPRCGAAEECQAIPLAALAVVRDHRGRPAVQLPARSSREQPRTLRLCGLCWTDAEIEAALGPARTHGGDGRA
jgi:hypothetical protein